jgi:hypothetical protein
MTRIVISDLNNVDVETFFTELSTEKMQTTNFWIEDFFIFVLNIYFINTISFSLINKLIYLDKTLRHNSSSYV